VKRGAVVAGAVAALLLAGGAAWWGLGGARAPQAAGAAARFVQPERRQIAASVLATGVVRLRTGAEVRVGSQVSGIVRKLNVTVGSRIRRGDVIAEIDDRTLRARLAQSRAQLGVSEQDVRRAEVDLARLRRLEERKLVAAKDVEDAALTLDAARARLEKARRDADVVATDLAYTVIRAPIAGTVASVSTQEGETVAASFSTPTFVTIIGDDALQLVAMVDETDIGNVAVGNAATFTVEAFPAREFTGVVERIAPRGTIISGVVNYEVMLRIEGPVEVLKPDMTANVSVRTAEREALVVPSDAVQREGSERFVYLKAGEQLLRRPVTLGTRQGGYTEIRRGLSGGEQVLVGAPPDADVTVATR